MTIPQTDQFVPLMATAPSTGKRDFQITVIPQKEQPQEFQSLEKTVPASGERVVFKKNCEPHVSVQREGERITNIRIQCNCGQTIDLACLYDETPKPA
jgi:hypothetical protein